MNIKRILLTREIEHSKDLKCQNYTCQEKNAGKKLIGWSKDIDGYVVVYECDNCESQFYFHPILERDNWEKFIDSIKNKKDIKYDIESYHIKKEKVMEEFHKFRKILCSNKYFYSEKFILYEEFLTKYWLRCDPETFRILSYFMGPNGEIAIRFKYEKITDYDMENILSNEIIYRKSDFN